MSKIGTLWCRLFGHKFLCEWIEDLEVHMKPKKRKEQAMKKIMCALFLTLLLVTEVQAMIFEPTWTGLSAWKNDGLGYIPEPAPSYIGGYAGTNSLGGAKQFTLADFTEVKSLVFNAYATTNDYGYDSLLFDWKIYNGDLVSRYGYEGQNTIPNYNALMISSPAKVYGGTVGDPVYNENVETDFRTDLAPGTYWLAFETPTSGGGPRTELESMRMATVHNPEPATIALFGSGIAFAIGKKRRFKSNAKI